MSPSEIAATTNSIAVDGSVLQRQGGIAIIDGLLDASTTNKLLREALEGLPAARAIEVTCSDTEEWRGGSPARKFLTAIGGPTQDALYGSLELSRILHELSGLELQPTGARGTYNFYSRPGDHLEIHRDIAGCEVALISALADHGPSEATGGTLCLYPDRKSETLSRIRASRDQGAFRVKLRPSQSILLMGGVVPHCVLPMEADQSRIVSVLCFQIAQHHISASDDTSRHSVGPCGCESGS